MAEKRMISKVISISKKVNLNLNSHFSRLLYTWMIPHTDDFGRMAGCPHKVKALVIPMLDETWQEVESTLSELHQNKLIEWYEIDGEMYIEIINFIDHQTGLHKRTKSKFPEVPNNSRKFPELPSELKGREGNRTEENRTEGKGAETVFMPSGNPIEDQLHKLMIECQLEEMDVYPMEQIFSYIGMIEIEVIEVAIKKASKKHINYALRTIEGMVKEGKTTKESVKYLQAVPDKPKKDDPELESRRVEIARSKWINEGKNPDEFRYNASTGA